MRAVFFYKSSQRQHRHRHDATWWFKVWAPVAVAVLVIACESTSTFSAANTSGWLRPVFQHLFGTFTDASWDSFHHTLRKSGHFIGYGTVGFTFLRAWLYTLHSQGRTALLSWRLESTLLAILSTAIVASCDEAHQALLPSRTGTPADVVLDTYGACAMSLLVWMICWVEWAELF